MQKNTDIYELESEIEFNKKSVGEKKYRYNLKNKGRNGYSSPKNRKKSSDEIFNNEIANRMVVDHHKIDGIRLYGNTCIQTCVPYDQTPHPNRNQSSKLNIKSKKTRQPGKIVQIGSLGENIFLGDANTVDDENILHNHNITIIINFGTNNPLCKYNIYFPDSKNISYQDFVKNVSRTRDIIHAHRCENILLACDRGVNRSAAIIMALLIEGFYISVKDYNSALTYLENVKTTKYPDWNNLTNFHLRNLLYAYSSDILTKKYNGSKVNLSLSH